MEQVENWESLLKQIKKVNKDGYLSAAARVDIASEIIPYDEADEKYKLGEFEYFLDGNEEMVLVLHEDAVIDGDLLPERDGFLSGIIALKNLTVKGSINGEWGREWLYVMGNLSADNIIIGDGFYEIMGNADVKNTLLRASCEGGIFVHKNISAEVVISDLAPFTTGNIVKGTVILLEDYNGKFTTELHQYGEDEWQELLITEVIEVDNDDDEPNYSIDNKALAQIVMSGKSILKNK